MAGISRHKLADAARRGAVDARISRRLRLRTPELDPVGLGLDRVGTDELLAGLPAGQRRAVEARVLRDEPYEQIDEAVSVQTARKRVSRALSALRSRLQEEER